MYNEWKNVIRNKLKAALEQFMFSHQFIFFISTCIYGISELFFACHKIGFNVQVLLFVSDNFAIWTFLIAKITFYIKAIKSNTKKQIIAKITKFMVFLRIKHVLQNIFIMWLLCTSMYAHFWYAEKYCIILKMGIINYSRKHLK